MENDMNNKTIIYLATLIVLFAVCCSPSEAQTAAGYNRKGVEAANRGDSSAALDNFDKALDQHNRMSGQAAHNMGWIYETKGKHSLRNKKVTKRPNAETPARLKQKNGWAICITRPTTLTAQLPKAKWYSKWIPRIKK